MRSVGAYEAKTHLPRLLKEVEKGESFVITNRGVPVAKLVPAMSEKSEDLEAMVERMRRARASLPKVTHQEILEMRDEGRKR